MLRSAPPAVRGPTAPSQARRTRRLVARSAHAALTRASAARGTRPHARHAQQGRSGHRAARRRQVTARSVRQGRGARHAASRTSHNVLRVRQVSTPRLGVRAAPPRVLRVAAAISASAVRRNANGARMAPPSTSSLGLAWRNACSPPQLAARHSPQWVSRAWPGSSTPASVKTSHGRTWPRPTMSDGAGFWRRETDDVSP